MEWVGWVGWWCVVCCGVCGVCVCEYVVPVNTCVYTHMCPHTCGLICVYFEMCVINKYVYNQKVRTVFSVTFSQISLNP